MLAIGSRLDADDIGVVRITSPLGGGGQGEVYVAESDALGRFAVKWYKPNWSTPEQLHTLTHLIERGSPDRRFLWPLAVVRSVSRASQQFGYLMPLCEPGFVPLARLVNGNLGRSQDPSFATVISTCLHLVESFRLLHAGGLCYRDISLSNVFFEPNTGDIRICDVDNVGIDDGKSKVLGTPLFMAPEIVRDPGHNTFPSRRTDLHSLAVLLFVLLFMEHPLIGKRVDMGLWDESHAIQHFGWQPVFIMSDADPSNRPLQEHVERYWQLYPEFLRQRFLTAFGAALTDPGARVTEGEWIRVLTELRDCMGTCPVCDATVFYDLRSGHAQHCQSCGNDLPRPLVVVVGKRRLIVSRHLRFGSDLLRSHAASDDVLARAVRHPHDPARLGLKNLTQNSWSVTTADGAEYTVGPQQAVELSDGMNVRVGDVEASITVA
jgi:DNA-binding helix-hairpin-helix protein with protein kinase domain